MVIRLTPDLEKALTEEAQKRGTTPEELALDCLREQFADGTSPAAGIPEQQTLAEFLTGHIGVLTSSQRIPGGAQLSQDPGKKFARGLAEKRRQEQV